MSEHKIIERLLDDLVTRVEALEEKADEIWVPIKDNWAYFISNKGRVKRYDDFYPKITLDKSKGYYRVYLNNKRHHLHRLLAEAFIANPENKPCVDHIDGDKQNNSLSNLRWATYSENAYNAKKQANKSSRFKGVYFNNKDKKYQAQIWLGDGKMKYLGQFASAEEANAVRAKTAQELHGKFYRAQ